MSSTKRKARMAYIYDKAPLSSGKLRIRKSRAKQAPTADNSITQTAEGMDIDMEISDPTQSEQNHHQHDLGVGVDEAAESSDDDSTSSSFTAVQFDSDQNDSSESEEDSEFHQDSDTNNLWSQSDESQDAEFEIVKL